MTLSRPKIADALNTQIGYDLFEVFRELALDAGDLRCIVITGSERKAFCAGGDLKERNHMDDITWRRQHSLFEQAIYSIMDCAIPTKDRREGVLAFNAKRTPNFSRMLKILSSSLVLTVSSIIMFQDGSFREDQSETNYAGASDMMVMVLRPLITLRIR